MDTFQSVFALKEGPTPPPPPPPVETPSLLPRSREIWFSDGNLILEAENTSFRVYGQLIAAKSTILADILSLPHYSVDGIPVVRLMDSDADVEALLRALLDSDFFMPPPAPTELSTVLSILRLSHNGNIRYLLRRALLHLDVLYSTDLDKFLAVSPTPCGHISFPEPTVAGHLQVLKAAMDVNAKWLLPTVHYSIACSPLRQIIVLGAPWTALPEQTRNLIMLAHSWRLDRCYKIHSFALKGVPESGCEKPLACARSFSHCATTLIGLIARDQPVDPLRFWDEEGIVQYERTRCGVCRAGMREECAQAREDVWAGLPRRAECPTWPELQVLRDKAMERL
ncbi:hypothetical protein R3P38DRAFT_3056126, partial [Favolaschia claudopus]